MSLDDIVLKRSCRRGAVAFADLSEDFGMVVVCRHHDVTRSPQAQNRAGLEPENFDRFHQSPVLAEAIDGKMERLIELQIFPDIRLLAQVELVELAVDVRDGLQ